MHVEHPYAEIIGWGTCLPSTVLTNDTLARYLDTTDEWIVRRTGISQRPISHVLVSELGAVAGLRALACAGVSPDELDLIILGSCTADQLMPNTASAIQRALKANQAATIDLNTACTSFMHGLSIATAMIATNRANTAMVIGADTLSRYMDWRDRRPSVLFGDGAGAFVLKRTERPVGVLVDVLGCVSENRDRLRIRGIGPASDIDQQSPAARFCWDFDGPEIFRIAVQYMTKASELALARLRLGVGQMSLLIPHQANSRILNAVAEKLGAPEDKLFASIQKRGNLSSASIPVAIVDALSEERIRPDDLILAPAFGGGMTWSAHVIRWGDRVSPLSASDAKLPPSDMSAAEIVESLRRAWDRRR